MSNCYITAEPCSIEDFVKAATNEGFSVDETVGLGVSLVHPDGRGCYGCGEEEHDDEIYVGSMGDPEITDIDMVAEGSDEYLEICADDYEDEDDDDE